MKSRGSSITSCLSMANTNSSDSLTNFKLLSTSYNQKCQERKLSYTSQQNQERKLSESSRHSSTDKILENSFDDFCRICHDNGDEEQLMTACKCLGSIKCVHHNCLLNWISRSGELQCELCRYNFKVTRTSRKRFSEWQLPVIGIQGWLHIILFFAFLSMLVTSITWVIWSQTSTSSAAVFERTSSEIKYAYLLNGVFILTAVVGISLDSFRQAKKYFQRSLALNQELSIEEFSEEDAEAKPKFDDTELLIPRKVTVSDDNSRNSKKEEGKRISSTSSDLSEQSVFVEIDLDNDKTTSTLLSYDHENSRLSIGFESLQNLEETCI